MVGDRESEVGRVLVSLDLTLGVLKEAEQKGVDLIITHHPVIFNPLENVMSDSLVYRTVKSGISVISAHTNLDIAEDGVNAALIKTLGINEYFLSDNDVFLKIAEINPVSSDELIKKVAEKLNASVSFNNVKKTVKRIGFCSGAGSSCLYSAIDEGIDAFITGEAKYNMYSDAEEKDVLLIAAGHYETERIIVPVLCEKLKARFPEVEIIESDEKNPVNYYTK
jgi:dinuclear metal center YbgI/SA1388 family protein